MEVNNEPKNASETHKVGDHDVSQEEKLETSTPTTFTITKEFLEFAFDREVIAFSIKLGSNPGDNYMSIMHAAEVFFKGEEEAKHYLLKCYPNHQGYREWLDQVNVFGQELFIYQEFIPALKQTLKKIGAVEDIVWLSSAPFHGGNVGLNPSPKWKESPWAKENFIIMTDIRKSEGFVMADRFKGLDMEHAILALQEMARWHAMAWAHKEFNGWPLLSTKYPMLIENMYSNTEMIESFRPYLELVNRNALKVTEASLGADHPAHVSFKKVVDSGVLEIVAKFVKPYGIAEEVFDNLMRVKHTEEDEPGHYQEPWLTGTHGDCWMNNMLFRYDDSGEHPKPVQVTFVDLQIYREACPTLDIAYFLSSSVRAPLRLSRIDELLQAYHDSFARSCRELKVAPFPGFSMDSLKRRYRRASLFGLMMSLDMLAYVLKPEELEFDLNVSKNDKEDASDLFSKVVENSHNNEKFTEEIVATVLNLYKDGVI